MSTNVTIEGVDLQGGASALPIEEQQRPTAEDNTNALIATLMQLVNVGDYSPSVYVNTGTAATENISATQANLYSFYGKNTNAATRYLQFHNTAGTPAGAAVPVLSFVVPAGEVLSIGEEFFKQAGIHFDTGLAMAWSTTEWTYTAATAADHSLIVLYNN